MEQPTEHRHLEKAVASKIRNRASQQHSGQKRVEKTLMVNQQQTALCVI